mgnify:CR=1 FL=1
MEKQQLLNTLKEYFGYDSFRPLQEKIIQSIFDGKDNLVIMPTGGGKSICYQLPAILLPKLTIVISPLIALMKDQVDGLTANGVPAAFLNSSQTESQQQEIFKKIDFLKYIHNKTQEEKNDACVYNDFNKFFTKIFIGEIEIGSGIKYQIFFIKPNLLLDTK